MVKLYVEGGGDTQLLKSACRKGFTEFLAKAGLKGSLPRVVAGGSRNNAYEMFCTSIKQGEPALCFQASPWAQRFIETLRVYMGQG
jgi:hypothetical protein